MKIAWFCIPAQGHTNPTLGLVRYVVEAGHQVTYFSFERFRRQVLNLWLAMTMGISTWG